METETVITHQLYFKKILKLKTTRIARKMDVDN